MAPRRRAAWIALGSLAAGAIAAAAIAATIGWRTRARRLPSPSERSLEYVFRVEAARAPGERFRAELSAFVSSLRASGVRVAGVFPDPQRARVAADRLDGDVVARALAG